MRAWWPSRAWALVGAWAWISVVLGACSSPSSPSSPAEPPPQGGSRASDEPSNPVVAPPSLVPSYEVVQRICASPCAGPFARLTVLRDARGDAARIRFDGDLRRCSHPPLLYFDLQGNELDAIPEEPIVPGSPRAKELEAKQDAMTKGLTAAEILGCTDPAFCEPERTEGFRSELPCRADYDCVDCDCMPIDRAGWQERGGVDACVDPSAECIATNPVCCDGRCMLAR